MEAAAASSSAPVGAPQKRMTSKPAMEFSKKSKTFMGYETYFLKAQITVLLNDPVKVIQTKSLNNQIRLGLGHISPSDRTILESHTLAMMEVFPASGFKIKGLFPAKQDDLVFFTADENTALFSEKKIRLPLKELPRISTCRVAISLSGMKTKDNEVSFMSRVIQLKLEKQPKENRLNSNTECLFEDSKDEDDTDEYDESTYNN